MKELKLYDISTVSSGIQDVTSYIKIGNKEIRLIFKVV